MKRVALLTTVLALVASFPLASGHGEAPGKKKVPKADPKVSELMRQKLEHSQKILEGIALEDFDLIGKHADELIVLSKRLEWKVLKTPKYEVHSNDFRRAAEDLIRNAKDKNLDAASLSYVELTLTCVRCHKHVREVRMARRD
jgi:hypothetical protein